MLSSSFSPFHRLVGFASQVHFTYINILIFFVLESVFILKILFLGI